MSVLVLCCCLGGDLFYVAMFCVVCLCVLVVLFHFPLLSGFVLLQCLMYVGCVVVVCYLTNVHWCCYVC